MIAELAVLAWRLPPRDAGPPDWSQAEAYLRDRPDTDLLVTWCAAVGEETPGDQAEWDELLEAYDLSLTGVREHARAGLEALRGGHDGSHSCFTLLEWPDGVRLLVTGGTSWDDQPYPWWEDVRLVDQLGVPTRALGWR